MLAAAPFNENAASGDDLLQAALARRLLLHGNFSSSVAHTWEIEARGAAKFF
jgi:hypothetical protein